MSRQKLVSGGERNSPGRIGKYGGIDEEDNIGWGDGQEKRFQSSSPLLNQAERSLNDNVEKLHTLLGQLEQNSKNKQAREEAKLLIPVIRQQLKNPPKSMNRQAASKLERDFIADTERFQNFMKKEIERGSSDVQNIRKHSLGQDYNDTERYQEQQQDQRTLSTQHIHVVTEEMLIQEKNKEILALEDDLREISSLMKEVSVLVNESQTGF
eukprot:c9838_g1_i2.p1 GENE.c9838_g1_i2~~c9838_g1_i2.p1  ORF type:complete len:211 (+),score=87.68 c9838_g1_i2:34-666(+)